MAKRTDSTTPSAKPRTPEMATQAQGTQHPFVDIYPAFYLAYHPDRWSVIAGKLVPALSRVNLAAGVNECEVDPTGRVKFAKTRAKLETEGRTLIPYVWAPDGISYLQCIDTRPEGKPGIVETWITVFESADAGSRETTPDEEAYADWLVSLVEAGKLPKCPVNTARKLLDRSTERLEQARADAAKLGGHGRATIRARALEIEAKVLEEYVAGGKAEKAKAKAKRAPVLDDATEGAA